MARIRELPPAKPVTPLERAQAWLRSEWQNEQKRAANLVRGALPGCQQSAAPLPLYVRDSTLLGQHPCGCCCLALTLLRADACRADVRLLLCFIIYNGKGRCADL